MQERTGSVFGEFGEGRSVASFLSTTRDILFSPRRFFDGLPPDGPAWPPVLYFLICYLVATLVGLVATAPFFAAPALILVTNGPPEGGLVLALTLAFFLVFLVAFSVLFVALFFAGVPFQHACVRLFAGGDQRGLRATLRVTCYSVGAPILLSWIPFAAFLATPYCFYLYTTGLRRVHGISAARALAAVLLPVVLSFILVAGGIFLYVAVRG